jgi:hypothetical protein
MSTDIDVEQLQRDVQVLKDRLAIQDCLMRHCRGVDRHDAELMSSCYHPDAVVKHGNSDSYISGADYGTWSNTAHESGRFALHAHQITNMTCELDGDVAYTESYVITMFLHPDHQRTSMVTGRYLDRFERRDGEWRIAMRRAFLDIAVEGDATYFGNHRGRPVDPQMFWTRADVSYQRPFDLSTPGPQWT